MSNSPLKSAGISALRLGVFALGTAVALGVTYALTRENIAAAQREVEARTLMEVIQDIPHDNDILSDSLEVPADGRAILHTKDQLIHVARQNGEPVAFIFPSMAPDGYSGAIYMLVGIGIDGQISGVRVTTHGETPGLGDKVDIKKSNWITGFAGLSLAEVPDSQWAVRKDGGRFDAFTGATITPRAVVAQIKRTLDYYAANRDLFIDMTRAETAPMEP
jgi:H+/Na+-translocating ferredoxin:NAD+ oxidoreductase subunit G